MTESDLVIRRGTLPGGSTYENHTVWEDRQGVYLIDLAEYYPGRDAVARNRGRKEYVTVLEGGIALTVNGQTIHLKRRESYLIGEDKYHIMRAEELTTLLVLVNDRAGARTDILPILKLG